MRLESDRCIPRVVRRIRRFEVGGRARFVDHRQGVPRHSSAADNSAARGSGRVVARVRAEQQRQPCGRFVNTASSAGEPRIAPAEPKAMAAHRQRRAVLPHWLSARLDRPLGHRVVIRRPWWRRLDSARCGNDRPCSQGRYGYGRRGVRQSVGLAGMAGGTIFTSVPSLMC